MGRGSPGRDGRGASVVSVADELVLSSAVLGSGFVRGLHFAPFESPAWRDAMIWTGGTEGLLWLCPLPNVRACARYESCRLE